MTGGKGRTRYDVVLHSIHQATEGGHGGNRRLSQVVALLRSSAATVTCSADTFGGSLAHNLVSVARGALPSARGAWGRFRSLRALRNSGAAHRLLDWTSIGSSTLLVFDSFLRGYEPVFARARAAGARLAIFPQNLDSLTADSIDPLTSKRAPTWFHEELDVLRKADVVACLSREDQWLLSLYGIASFYLPYYPSPSLRKELHGIRMLRAGIRKDRFVILGSAVNRPTLDGMKELLERSVALTAAAGACEVVLVGFGTERLRAADVSRRIRVLGGVSNEVMQEQLVSARAVICCQTGTTGALTRIPELLCAGVPVIATYTAARSYFHLDGVHVAETIDDLCRLARDFLCMEPTTPAPPTQYEAAVLNAIEGLWSS